MLKYFMPVKAHLGSDFRFFNNKLCIANLEIEASLGVRGSDYSRIIRRCIRNSGFWLFFGSRDLHYIHRK